MKNIVLIALAIVAFAVQLFAEDGTSFYQKALENIKAENFKSAFDNLSKALALEPQNNLYKKEMAFVQYKRKANREAIILIEEFINANYFYGIYYGIILSMLLYNLFIYLSIREKSYLFYIIFLFFFVKTE